MADVPPLDLEAITDLEEETETVTEKMPTSLPETPEPATDELSPRIDPQPHMIVTTATMDEDSLTVSNST